MEASRQMDIQAEIGKIIEKYQLTNGQAYDVLISLLVGLSIDLKKLPLAEAHRRANEATEIIFADFEDTNPVPKERLN